MKAEGDIKDDAIQMALVGYAGFRGDFKRGSKVILNCFVLDDFCKAVLHLGVHF